jgi:hypothetical protein
MPNFGEIWIAAGGIIAIDPFSSPIPVPANLSSALKHLSLRYVLVIKALLKWCENSTIVDDSVIPVHLSIALKSILH